MSSLITSDLHFTDKPRDQGRWALLPWLADQVRKRKIEHVIILGDLTDAKDRHPAIVVNKFLDGLRSITDQGARIHILKANHDYFDPQWPFFGFTQLLENVRYYGASSAERIRVGKSTVDCLFLPSVKNPDDWGSQNFKEYSYIFAHQTFDGARAENGTVLESVAFTTRLFKGSGAKVYSGDIHVPQELGNNVEYVGAPYRVHFGDIYTPRVVYIDSKDTVIDLDFPCASKHLIVMRNMDDLRKAVRQQHVMSADQVKVRCMLKRSEFGEWRTLRNEIQEFAAKANIELYGPELVPMNLLESEDAEKVRESSKEGPVQVLRKYAKQQKAGTEIEALGMSILKEVTGGKR